MNKKRLRWIRHFFDGEIWSYRTHQKSQQAGAERMRAEVSTSFRGLSLSGERVSYRLVLAGDPGGFGLYAKSRIEIAINDVGYRGAGQRLSTVPRKGQFNFEFDFKAPQGQADHRSDGPPVRRQIHVSKR